MDLKTYNINYFKREYKKSKPNNNWEIEVDKLMYNIEILIKTTINTSANGIVSLLTINGIKSEVLTGYATVKGISHRFKVISIKFIFNKTYYRLVMLPVSNSEIKYFSRLKESTLYILDIFPHERGYKDEIGDIKIKRNRSVNIYD